MPGDWTLGLEWPTCGIDDKPCRGYLARCDQCGEKEQRARDAKKGDSDGGEEKLLCN